jgi:hypothetical protein
MPLILNFHPEETLMINGELLITVRKRKGKISLEFEGPQEKYRIERAERLRERTKKETECPT